MTSTNTLSFYSPSSRIDPSFWETLYQIKLEKMKLESASLVISANLSIFQNLNAVYFMRESFDGDSSFPFDMGFPVEYRNFNTIEVIFVTVLDSVIHSFVFFSGISIKR